MADPPRGWIQGNVVLIAAFVLPAVVAVLFVLATAIPRMSVPPPQHDLVLRVERWQSPPPPVSVEFVVREGRLEADVRALARPEGASPAPYAPRWGLLIFDSTSMAVREIPLDLPESVPPGETHTVVVEALADRSLTTGPQAPDGYAVTNVSSRGGGLVGEIFGMSGGPRRGVSIARNGRTIEVPLPPRDRDGYGAIVPIGWTR